MAINNLKVVIQSVKSEKNSDIVIHQVKREELPISGEEQLPIEVELMLDEEKRRLNARLHSAGHLLDVAVRNIGLVVYFHS